MAFEDFSYNSERVNAARAVIQSLNKASLSAATGISYSRLRKYSSGMLMELTTEEKAKIREYLLTSAQQFE